MAANSAELANYISARLTTLRNDGVYEANRKIDPSTLGLIDLGSGAGSFVKAIGYSPAAPDLAIKVVDKGDAWVSYVSAILEGKLVGQHYPVIHSMTIVGDDAVVVMERLRPIESRSVYEAAYKSFSTDMHELYAWASKNELTLDLHDGNIMMRGGVYVWIDPVWNPGTAKPEAVRQDHRPLGGVGVERAKLRRQVVQVPSHIRALLTITPEEISLLNAGKWRGDALR